LRLTVVVGEVVGEEVSDEVWDVVPVSVAEEVGELVPVVVAVNVTVLVAVVCSVVVCVESHTNEQTPVLVVVGVVVVIGVVVVVVEVGVVEVNVFTPINEDVLDDSAFVFGAVVVPVVMLVCVAVDMAADADVVDGAALNWLVCGTVVVVLLAVDDKVMCAVVATVAIEAVDRGAGSVAASSEDEVDVVADVAVVGSTVETSCEDVVCEDDVLVEDVGDDLVGTTVVV
jgi:hypothetical protein